MSPLRALLLLTASASDALLTDSVWRSPSAQLHAAAKRAVRDVGLLGEATNHAVAQAFTWEHSRAYRYERLGAHSYWDDPRIHNFGNVGWRGLLHAMVVPVATHAIDQLAYAGVDVRRVVHDSFVRERLSAAVKSPPPPRRLVGVDTSEQMLALARLRRPEAEFVRGNAEVWGEARCCDVASVMYAMHEMPRGARRRVLRNALRLARARVLVVDIWPGFKPTPMMLSGEPYVLDYLKNIDSDVLAAVGQGEWDVERIDLVAEHVTMWKMDRRKPVEDGEACNM
ncbi:hypothetical protein AB1Y20_016759 [Prymnesium parvum]|uniref:Methyltransferase domain-containing protein n=1 Tax=Prymnesium parvum TaxID=97485 RepID=A0AB34IB00_PRYPA